MVPDGHVAHRLWFGKYDGQLESGFHFLWPGMTLERIHLRYQEMNEEDECVTVSDNWVFIPKDRVAIYNCPSYSVICENNALVDIDLVCYYMIANPFAFRSHDADPLYSLQLSIQTALRNCASEIILNDLSKCKVILTSNVMRECNEDMKLFGIQITRVDIQEITLPECIVTQRESEAIATMKQKNEIARKMEQLSHERKIKEEEIRIANLTVENDAKTKKARFIAKLDEIKLKNGMELLKYVDMKKSGFDDETIRHFITMSALKKTKGLNLIVPQCLQSAINK